VDDHDEFTTDDVLRIARAVAARYKRRCWWADAQDLASEASQAVLEAQERFDPQVGIPFSSYAARAASYAVQDYLWKQSSPVSGGGHDPRRCIAGVHRAPLDAPLRAGPDGAARVRPELWVWDDDPLVEAELEAWRLSVRERIRVLAEQVKDGDLAVEVMVRGRAPQEVIRETGRNAHRAVERVRRMMREDYPMWSLWMELT
jgi:Sigma-70 region 2